MAQLKDTIITGDASITGTTYTALQTNTIKAPSTSGGSTYSTGTSGQVLMTNGTSVYWGSLPEFVNGDVLQYGNTPVPN